ncbi:hypothetical protein FDO65_11465 [Nakamurella flava]|uniref:Trypsin-like peptidase domain-containing protein n=1 Tax=Nakamurella flava TaxID=2576308 RepID=A0A4U6QG13_9ACTN|nr:hypothetical protein [Nakamurella flava]TKV59237.1 hypothetical protein FDO65_11465 [Nakamurella flava]
MGTQYACTTSWATRDSDGEVTMMSAGHCDNSGTYQGVTLQYKGEFYFTNYDWQLWRGSGMDIRARFYDGSQYQPVLGYSPGVPAYNDLVCKYGRTLGARCGRVISTIEAPSYVPNATNTFIKVHSDAYAVTAGGDSGGPVYVGRIAFGLISGVVNSNGDMIYNRAGYLFDNGKRILIANDLTSGETINPDLLNYRIAFNSQYKLTMQPDGNLVLYKNN